MKVGVDTDDDVDLWSHEYMNTFYIVLHSQEHCTSEYLDCL